MVCGHCCVDLLGCCFTSGLFEILSALSEKPLFSTRCLVTCVRRLVSLKFHLIFQKFPSLRFSLLCAFSIPPPPPSLFFLFFLPLYKASHCLLVYICMSHRIALCIVIARQCQSTFPLYCKSVGWYLAVVCTGNLVSGGPFLSQ